MREEMVLSDGHGNDSEHDLIEEKKMLQKLVLPSLALEEHLELPSRKVCRQE